MAPSRFSLRFRRLLAPAPLVLALALGASLVGPAVRGGALTEESTPAPTPTPGPNTAREAVIDAAFATLPPAPFVVTLTRLHLPPGSRAWGDGPAGPRFIIVESHEIVVTVAAGDFPVLTRAPTSTTTSQTPDTTTPPASGTLVLNEGDGVVLSLAPAELHNDGERPATLLIAAVTPLPAEMNGVLPVPIQGGEVALPTAASSMSTPAAAGIVADALPARPFMTAEEVLVEPLAGGTVLTLPPGPGEVRLDRLRIAAGWQTPLPVQPGPWLLLVESGTLGLAAAAGTIFYRGAAAPNPGSVPGRAKTVVPGTEVILTAGGMTFVHPEAVVELRNRGRTTLIVLTLTIWPARVEDV
jgi:hypothetical protein